MVSRMVSACNAHHGREFSTLVEKDQEQVSPIDTHADDKGYEEGELLLAGEFGCAFGRYSKRLSHRGEGHE